MLPLSPMLQDVDADVNKVIQIVKMLIFLKSWSWKSWVQSVDRISYAIQDYELGLVILDSWDWYMIKYIPNWYDTMSSLFK